MSIQLDGYKLTFSDEFNGTYLDTSVWSTRYLWGARTNSSNGEQQYYADRSTHLLQISPYLEPFKIIEDPADVQDGVLLISANPSPDTYLSDGLPYVSGMITTAQSFSQIYGYFEIRAQVPSGQGLWPAFWLLPTDGTWPPEIDVLELLGHDTTTYYAGTHWMGDDGTHRSQTTAVPAGTDLSLDFHIFGTSWTPDTISFYLDGELVSSVATPDDMHVPMYILANLAVGGYWPGSPDATTAFPAEFKIDYIKAWSAMEPAGRVLNGSSSADNLIGGGGHDTLRGFGGNDKLYGVEGNDQLYGGDGHDQLYGGDGSDILAGGKGKDSLFGGFGADVFVFEHVSDSAPQSKDTVADFISGTDKIDLRLLDANTKPEHHQNFVFVGADSFTGQAGQLRFASGVLLADVNGDKKADLEVALTGLAWLQSSDLYL